MPITLQGSRSGEVQSLQLDEYVPVTLEWPGYTRQQEAPASVMLDVAGSLVEMKTERSSGEVVEVVIIDLLNADISEGSMPVPEITEHGIPLLGFEGDSDGSGGVQLYDDGIKVRLGQDCATKGIGDPVAIFGFSGLGHLVEINVRLGVDGMTQLRSFCGISST